MCFPKGLGLQKVFRKGKVGFNEELCKRVKLENNGSSWGVHGGFIMGVKEAVDAKRSSECSQARPFPIYTSVPSTDLNWRGRGPLAVRYRDPNG